MTPRTQSFSSPTKRKRPDTRGRRPPPGRGSGRGRTTPRIGMTSRVGTTSGIPMAASRSWTVTSLIATDASASVIIPAHEGTRHRRRRLHRLPHRARAAGARPPCRHLRPRARGPDRPARCRARGPRRRGQHRAPRGRPPRGIDRGRHPLRGPQVRGRIDARSGPLLPRQHGRFALRPGGHGGGRHAAHRVQLQLHRVRHPGHQSGHRGCMPCARRTPTAPPS